MNYKRGDVYLVTEDVIGSEIKKTRYWILVGANPINKARRTLLAIPLSTKVNEIHSLSIKVFVNGAMVCAVIDQLRALDKRRFIKFEGSLSLSEMDLIDDGLRQVLAL